VRSRQARVAHSCRRTATVGVVVRCHPRAMVSNLILRYILTFRHITTKICDAFAHVGRTVRNSDTTLITPPRDDPAPAKPGLAAPCVQSARFTCVNTLIYDWKLSLPRAPARRRRQHRRGLRRFAWVGWATPWASLRAQAPAVARPEGAQGGSDGPLRAGSAAGGFGRFARSTAAKPATTTVSAVTMGSNTTWRQRCSRSAPHP